MFFRKNAVMSEGHGSSGSMVTTAHREKRSKRETINAIDRRYLNDEGKCSLNMKKEWALPADERERGERGGGLGGGSPTNFYDLSAQVSGMANGSRRKIRGAF